MWKHTEDILGITLGSGLAVALLTIPREFLLEIVKPPEPLAKKLRSPIPLLILFGLVVGWMSHAVVVREDVDFMNSLRLCKRTNPVDNKPFDVCDHLNEVQREAIMLPYAECRMAMGVYHPWGELACKRPGKDGWRL